MQIFDYIDPIAVELRKQCVKGKLLVKRGVRRVVDYNIETGSGICQFLQVFFVPAVAANERETRIVHMAEIADVESKDMRTREVFEPHLNRWRIDVPIDRAADFGAAYRKAELKKIYRIVAVFI